MKLLIFLFWSYIAYKMGEFFGIRKYDRDNSPEEIEKRLDRLNL